MGCVEGDLNTFDGTKFKGADLFAGGLPCPPFSIAGKQLGALDERNLFPAAIRLIDEIRPRAVMIENVRGFLGAVFDDYRERLKRQLGKLGVCRGLAPLECVRVWGAATPSARCIVAIQKNYSEAFDWPAVAPHNPPTVGTVLHDLMAENGWRGARAWRDRADEIAPHGCRRLEEARRTRPWPDTRKDGLGAVGRRWNGYRGRSARAAVCWKAAPYCADGRAATGFPLTIGNLRDARRAHTGKSEMPFHPRSHALLPRMSHACLTVRRRYRVAG